MKRLSNTTEKSGLLDSLNLDFLKGINFPKIPFNKKIFFRVFFGIIIFILVIGIVGYVFIARPVLNVIADARNLRAGAAQVNTGLQELDLNSVKSGLEEMRTELNEFEASYEKNMNFVKRVPGVNPYYEDGIHLISVGEEAVELGDMVVEILEPYAADLGFTTDGVVPQMVPAQERIIKLLSLMPEFSPKVSEIAERMQTINDDLEEIDAARYPTQLPGYVARFGIDPNLNVREQILAFQSISGEVAAKAPQFESFFNAIPEFLGLNEPKKYLILMANNYELRMSGGFNTYIVVAEFEQGTPQITYSIDTYFIDEGERTGSSQLVDRNVPYFLRNYLYLPQNSHRLYARDATSTSPDFPVAADTLLDRFWRRDRTLPQDIDGVIQINNDIVVEILKVVGPVNTDSYTIMGDRGRITVPFTEFNSENVIEELENIAGGRLAETIGRKEIIRFLGQSLLQKIYASEATNLVNLTKVILDGLSKKDMMLYSFEPEVQLAFSDLGYAGEIVPIDETWDYLHVNRSNFGSGKADWTTSEGFITQVVDKNTEIRDGKAISTVKVTVKNPKRPSWYNIYPCCFYNAYLRVYVPSGSTLISVNTSDGQDPKDAEYLDEVTGKTFFETFTRQEKETDLDITFTYELPSTVDLDNYKILVQRQSGSSIDPYTIRQNGIGTEFLLNSDKEIIFSDL